MRTFAASLVAVVLSLSFTAWAQGPRRDGLWDVKVEMEMPGAPAVMPPMTMEDKRKRIRGCTESDGGEHRHANGEWAVAHVGRRSGDGPPFRAGRRAWGERSKVRVRPGPMRRVYGHCAGKGRTVLRHACW